MSPSLQHTANEQAIEQEAKHEAEGLSKAASMTFVDPNQVRPVNSWPQHCLPGHSLSVWGEGCGFSGAGGNLCLLSFCLLLCARVPCIFMRMVWFIACVLVFLHGRVACRCLKLYQKRSIVYQQKLIMKKTLMVIMKMTSQSHQMMSHLAWR